jgi:hypothetical protein
MQRKGWQTLQGSVDVEQFRVRVDVHGQVEWRMAASAVRGDTPCVLMSVPRECRNACRSSERPRSSFLAILDQLSRAEGDVGGFTEAAPSSSFNIGRVPLKRLLDRLRLTRATFDLIAAFDVDDTPRFAIITDGSLTIAAPVDAGQVVLV